MRWVVLVACACNSVLGIHATHLPDAPPPPPGCAGEQFQGPFNLPELDNKVAIMADPTLVGDGNELWFAGRTAAGAQQDLYFTTRASATDSFATPQLAVFDDPTADDSDPAFTADGLDLIFVSTRVSGQRLWETTRSALSDPFDMPHEIGELAGTGVPNGLDLSNDGLTLYYVTGLSSDLYMVTRPDRTKLFDVAHAQLVSSGVQTPGVSPDGLELFFDPTFMNNISRRTRATTDVPFGTDDTLVQAGATTPDVSADAQTLIFADTLRNGFEYKTRPCP
jgi:hypothetical protein